MHGHGHEDEHDVGAQHVGGDEEDNEGDDEDGQPEHVEQDPELLEHGQL